MGSRRGSFRYPKTAWFGLARARDSDRSKQLAAIPSGTTQASKVCALSLLYSGGTSGLLSEWAVGHVRAAGRLLVHLAQQEIQIHPSRLRYKPFPTHSTWAIEYAPNNAGCAQTFQTQPPVPISGNWRANRVVVQAATQRLTRG